MSLIDAAKIMDWQQVVLNGGPPCFHLCEDGRFCGRAFRWEGHKDAEIHGYVALDELLQRAKDEAREEAAVIADDGYDCICAAKIRAQKGK